MLKTWADSSLARQRVVHTDNVETLGTFLDKKFCTTPSCTHFAAVFDTGPGDGLQVWCWFGSWWRHTCGWREDPCNQRALKHTQKNMVDLVIVVAVCEGGRTRGSQPPEYLHPFFKCLEEFLLTASEACLTIKIAHFWLRNCHKKVCCESASVKTFFKSQVCNYKATLYKNDTIVSCNQIVGYHFEFSEIA